MSLWAGSGPEGLCRGWRHIFKYLQLQEGKVTTGGPGVEQEGVVGTGATVRVQSLPEEYSCHSDATNCYKPRSAYF